MTDKPETFEDAVSIIAGNLADTVCRKQKDYGKANINDFGELGIFVRSNDKFARLKNLILNKKSPVNETIDETWLDVAGYAIVAMLYRKGWFDLPLEADVVEDVPSEAV